MLAISLDTIIAQKIDSLLNLTDTMLVTQQVQSVKMDSITCLNTSLSEGQEAMYSGINTLQAQLQAISDFGIGYSDVLGHITLPLIVALFAFAFPFLFTVISHINNKYESENITGLFSAEPVYKWFLRGAAISSGYLIVVGILSLCHIGKSRGIFMIVLDWTSLIVAGGYAAIIVLFVRTCLDYNDPQRVMKRIDSWYDHYTQKAGGDKYGVYAAENYRIQRLIDLCRYSIRKQDNALFLSVIYKVNSLRHKNKESIYHNFVFFEDVVECYMYSSQNSKIEDTLMMYWFMTFNSSEIPNRGTIYRMLGKIVAAVKQGRYSLFETYWNHAKHGFRFIDDLPVVSYVRGSSTHEQINVGKGTRSTLRELCEMHFIALAYLFSEGYTDIVKMILNNDSFGGFRILPQKGVDALRMYAECKKHQMPGGRFSYMISDDVVGENIDPEMLEKFTAILLLTTSLDVENYMCLVKEENLKTIISAKDNLVKYGKMWQNDDDLCAKYPQIKKVDVAKLFQKYVKSFEKVSTAKGVYSAQLDDTIKNKIDAAYMNLLYGNQTYILDSLVGENDESKDRTLSMGEYTYKTYKQIFTEKWDIDYNYDLFSQSRIFQSRYLFMVYTAINEMKIKEKEVVFTDLKKCIEDYMQGKGEDYVVIETGSASLLLMELDHKDSRGWNHWSFKKADYKHYDLSLSWFLKDVEEVKPFDNSVIVMKKKDLPYVQYESDPYGPKLSYEDESNENEAEAVARIIVNPNLQARYSRNAEVLRIKVDRKVN